MRCELLALTLAMSTACASNQAARTCSPVSSWASPMIACEAGAVAAIVEPPPPPPPPPEPAPEPPAAVVKDETIDLKEKVNFETGSANLVEQSKTLLDEVAKILDDHPELEKIQIEGHTDGEGTNAYNLRLSNQRAAAVRTYLVSRGVDEKRLVSKGFGEEKPVASNDTPEGREQNRRVEMRILKRKDK